LSDNETCLGDYSHNALSPAGKSDLLGYDYGAISFPCLTADRSVVAHEDKERDGAGRSLGRCIDPEEMSLGLNGRPGKERYAKKKKAGEKQDVCECRAKRKQEAGGIWKAYILEASEEVKGLTYRRRVEEKRDV
jgi:hypothetical protein